jgi:hypothetical protein
LTMRTAKNCATAKMRSEGRPFLACRELEAERVCACKKRRK